jgi:predicted enzyme related to lactoylglutathione lyase
MEAVVMIRGLRTVIYHVGNLDEGKRWYSTILDRAPHFDQPFYVGFQVGGFELGLVPDGKSGAGGTVAYWGVESCADALARLQSLGAVVREPLQDVGEGIQVAAVADPFGNTFGIIENPHFDAGKAE